VSGGIDACVGIEDLFGLSIGIECGDGDGTLSLEVGPERVKAVTEERAVGSCLITGGAS